MFVAVRVPILGHLVETMSYFTQGHNPERETPIFGVGGEQKLADESRVPPQVNLPIDPRVAECGDGGEPIVRKYPDSPVAKAYMTLATTVAAAANKPGNAPLPQVQLAEIQPHRSCLL